MHESAVRHTTFRTHRPDSELQRTLRRNDRGRGSDGANTCCRSLPQLSRMIPTPDRRRRHEPGLSRCFSIILARSCAPIPDDNARTNKYHSYLYEQHYVTPTPTDCNKQNILPPTPYSTGKKDTQPTILCVGIWKPLFFRCSHPSETVIILSFFSFHHTCTSFHYMAYRPVGPMRYAYTTHFLTSLASFGN